MGGRRVREDTGLRMWPMLAFGALLGLAVVLLWPGPSESSLGSSSEPASGARPGSSSASPSPAPRTPAISVALRPEREAAEVLRQWDQRRAEAWAAGDTRALSNLYADTASAGAADVAMLRRWVKKGLRVQGLAMQVLALNVVEHSPGRWRLEVTDRVAAADVVGPGAEASLVDPEMPPGAARTRVVELREAEGTWKMVSVKDT